MKFRMRVRVVGTTDDWWEDYDKPGTDAERVARQIIDSFNGSLRPYEQPRELLEVVLLDGRRATSAHDFRKTNLVTISGRGGLSYDTYRCANCGITARRYGLDSSVVLDSKYKATFYRDCGAVQARKKR